jgi:dimethylaniline monooxygenase (N-oxide forming)
VDHVRTYRKYTILQLMARYAPSLWETTLNSVIKKLQNQVFQVRPEWGFEPAPSIAGQRPLVSDDLVDCLINGTVKSTVGVDRVLDGTHVEMTDGTVIEVDAILFCTGFTVDYSVVGPDADPTRHTTKDWNRAIGSNGKWLPRLYQNIFSLDHPDSLAFMGNLSFMNPAFFMFDLGAMALAQLWSGKSRFPSIDEMNRHVDAHHQWVIEKATRGPVMPSIVKSTDWMQWVNETAGTNVDKFMGYTWLGWKMWFSDRKFCNMLMDGLLSPHLYRLFPGTKRRQWLGAEEAIITMNKDITKRFGPMD